MFWETVRKLAFHKKFDNFTENDYVQYEELLDY